MMKLAFSLFKYFPYGGLQRDFLRIADECLLRGHEVHVFTMHWSGDLLPGIKLHLLKVKGWRNHTRCFRFAEVFKKKLSENNFDLVIGFNKMPALDFYYAADVCYEARAQQKNFFYRLQSRYQRFFALEKAVFSKENRTNILLLAPQQQHIYASHYNTDATRFHLIPPGIAKDRIAPHNATEIRQIKRKQLGFTNNEFMILMVGSGFKTKGVDRALKTLAALPQHLQTRCRLIIIGEDNLKFFKKLAHQWHVAPYVHFFGGRDDVPEFLLAADLLLHPAYHENTGTVLLEAMAAGLPVITTDVCGYAHYIHSANAGIVLPSPFSQTALTQALTQMLQSEEARIQFQAAALYFAKNTDIYRMPTHVVDLLETQGRTRYALPT